MLSTSQSKRKQAFDHVLGPPDHQHTSSLTKRLKTHPDQPPTPQVLTIDSPSPSPTPPPPSLESVNQSNKLIWVDVGIHPDQTYWWPGLVYDAGPSSYVSLLPDPKSQLIDSEPKLLSSFKATKPFQVHSKFQPNKLNPILEDEELRTKYPTLESLEEAYVIGREKHVIYSFQEDDDLPDLSTCMVPLSQESRALLENVLSQDSRRSAQSVDQESDLSSPEREEHESSVESSLDELDQTLDQPDLELDIPGEPVLSRTYSKSQHYWPAKILSYAGLQTCKRRFKNLKNGSRKTRRLRREKFYELEFFDGSLDILPRSRFWTTDQDEFYQVEIGRVATEEVNFDEVIPQIEEQFGQLDLIISCKSSDHEIMQKHENFFANQKSKEIPQDVKYAKYGEELIHKMGQILIRRYLPTQNGSSEEPPKKIEVDERFEKLTEPEKSRYIFDILVPHLIWLITVQQYMNDATTELSGEEGQKGWGPTATTAPSKPKTAEEVLERAKKLARLVIQEVDLVDKVTSLRVRKNQLRHPVHLPKLRQTYNSRRTCQRSP